MKGIGENMKKLNGFIIGTLFLLTLSGCASSSQADSADRQSAVSPSEPIQSVQATPSEPIQSAQVSTTESVPNQNAINKASDFRNRAANIEAINNANSASNDQQYTMNQKAAEVAELWDNLLNEVYNYLKTSLPKEEFKKIESEEIAWVQQKETAVEAAAKEYEGGTMQSLVRQSTVSEWTSKRVYKLIDCIH